MRHCLVVDDSEVIRKIARRVLETMRFEVSEAQSGQEALETIQVRSPDAVFLDWSMPDTTGLQILGSLRLSSDRKPYILYCTTENDADDIALALAAGADDVLFKPFHGHELETKMVEAGLG
jgi:two-component system, chemotaxis family, chemotaxis protein CheY